MPLYEYECSNKKCDFYVEELFSVKEINRPVGTPCPKCKADVQRCISRGHVQDFEFTDKEKTDLKLRNPTGEFREIMQNMANNSPVLNPNDKKNLKDKYNL